MTPNVVGVVDEGRQIRCIGEEIGLTVKLLGIQIRSRYAQNGIGIVISVSVKGAKYAVLNCLFCEFLSNHAAKKLISFNMAADENQLNKKSQDILPRLCALSRIRTGTSIGHHPLKMACLPISPPEHFFGWAKVSFPYEFQTFERLNE